MSLDARLAPPVEPRVANGDDMDPLLVILVLCLIGLIALLVRGPEYRPKAD